MKLMVAEYILEKDEVILLEKKYDCICSTTLVNVILALLFIPPQKVIFNLFLGVSLSHIINLTSIEFLQGKLPLNNGQNNSYFTSLFSGIFSLNKIIKPKPYSIQFISEMIYISSSFAISKHK